MPTGKTDKKVPNRTIKALTKISDETGIKIEMVSHILKSIVKERKNGINKNLKNITNFVIIDLLNNDNGPLEKILPYNGINSSEDIGVIVKRLCQEGLLIKEETDNFDDFNGLFNQETIKEYVKDNNLKKDKDWYQIISYSLYTIGFAIVVSSYLTQVSNKIGWSGWLVGMLGWVLLTYRKKIESKRKETLNKLKTKRV